MLSRPVVTLLLTALLLVPGCGASGGTAPGSKADGWAVGAEGNLSLPPGAKGYGMFDGKKGEKVRATATSDKEPVDLRLYLNISGKETELGKKEKSNEATLEAVVPADGSVTLQVSNPTNADTAVRYKMERHAGG
jgi:hypothetical protein